MHSKYSADKTNEKTIEITNDDDVSVEEVPS